MSKLIKTILFLAFGLLLFSCNTSEKKKIDASKAEKSEQMYAYSIDTTGISMVWTAYKITKKVGVSGTFDTISFNNENAFGSLDKSLVINEHGSTIDLAPIDALIITEYL